VFLKLSKSSLDHIFSKNISIDNIMSYIVKLNITDHFPTMIFITSNRNLNNNEEPEKPIQEMLSILIT